MLAHVHFGVINCLSPVATRKPVVELLVAGYFSGIALHVRFGLLQNLSLTKVLWERALAASQNQQVTQ